ncbi:glycosyltransferase family 4 protein [Bacillus mycoides]|uniref:glycosyltransferase family 4 protein n=1 Tax=Bacillus mycoides TaxID=1405 RepID=UPI003D0907AF
MKILLINKYYYVKGGSETYFFGLKKMLEDNGHEVIVFSMQDEKNQQSQFEDHFVKNVNYQEDSGILAKMQGAMKLIHSNEAYRKLCKLIACTKPDIAHVNLIYHQLTPSIFQALKKYNIPTVFTSHDYKLVCPNYKLFNNDEICTKCIQGNFVNCFKNRCHKDSTIYSLLLTMEAYWHKWLKSYDVADFVICPSKFMYNQLAENRIPVKKLVHLPNFLTNNFLEVEMNERKEKFILYYGRLSKEKGIDTLLDAQRLLGERITLKLIGTGPEEARLKARVEQESIQNVEFLGFKSGNDLVVEIKKAKATIIPSVWHEVFGLTIIESLSAGTPVIGSKVGGITELIQEGENGFLFERANEKELANKIERLINLSEDEYAQMARNSYRAKNEFKPEWYYGELVSIYEQAINNKKIRK